MTDILEIGLDTLTLGQQAVVWTLDEGHLSYGQGGRVTRLEPVLVLTGPDGTEHHFDRPRFGHDLVVYVEEPTDPRECVEFGPDCAGPVELLNLSTDGSSSGALRCEHHRDRRLDRFLNSIESDARSDVPPSWFDPTVAGESWDED